MLETEQKEVIGETTPVLKKRVKKVNAFLIFYLPNKDLKITPFKC